ncbi:iron ABC transporter permease [uncultured Bartonella sp.]|uniref:ABC transporter permease n=1 Tax=uncultured Bartonella sp. TaxID=104108 RepID=UPI0025CE4BBC|nr:iron ABC transporter permease [uncultured Bartonella sp.]
MEQNSVPPPRPFSWQRLRADAVIYRTSIILLLAIVVLTPVGLIVYQSFLDEAFFTSNVAFSFDAYRFVLTDYDFYRALLTTIIISVGMVVISVPTGGILAFLLVRTDLKLRKTLEILVLVPMFISSIVLAFGYTVALGPSGLISIMMAKIIGFVPWNMNSVSGIILVTALSHVPYVYLYVSASMHNLPSDLEEAARITGASIFRVSCDVTLPMVLPALIFSAALNLLLGFEQFGIPLVLGDPNGILVLTTYIYKLTTLFGAPTYQLMAVVAMVLIVLTLPLIFAQRQILKHSRRYAAVGGKGVRAAPLKLGTKGQILALSIIALWLLISVVIPIGGIMLRAFVNAWGQGVNVFDHLTLSNFSRLIEVRNLSTGIINTVILGVFGALVAVFIYLLIGLAGHRNYGVSGMLLDYIVLLPRALPGLIIGLAVYWVFLFVPFLTPLRPTIFSLLIAFIIVGLAYGLRLLQGTLLQVSPELEEAARVSGATIGKTWRDIVVPLVRPGLTGAWALIMILFLRDYATGVYLMSADTGVIGSLIIQQFETGAMDTIAALAFVSVILTAAALAIALKLGAKINE